MALHHVKRKFCFRFESCLHFLIFLNCCKNCQFERVNRVFFHKLLEKEIKKTQMQTIVLPDAYCYHVGVKLIDKETLGNFALFF